MPVATTPTVCKLQLGNMLTRLREQAGLNQSDAARIIHRKDRNKIALMEIGQGGLTPAELELLLSGYAVEDDELKEFLRQLRNNSSQRGRWTGYRKIYSDDFRIYVDLEEDSDLIRIAAGEIVPGLLQCEEYIEAMLAGVETDRPLQELTQARVARAEVLTKADPPEVEVVMSESCIRRKWGSDEVMEAQIDHLIKQSKLPNVMLQVLPFEPRGNRAQTEMAFRFTMLRIPSPDVAGPLELVYTEQPTDLSFDDDKKVVAGHDRLWRRLTSSALSPRETRSFLTEIGKSYG